MALPALPVAKHTTELDELVAKLIDDLLSSDAVSADKVRETLRDIVEAKLDDEDIESTLKERLTERLYDVNWDDLLQDTITTIVDRVLEKGD